MDTATKNRAEKYADAELKYKLPTVGSFASNSVNRSLMPAAALRIVERLEKQREEAAAALEKTGFKFPNDPPKHGYFYRCTDGWENWETLRITIDAARERCTQRIMRAIWNNEISDFDQIDDLIANAQVEYGKTVAQVLTDGGFPDKIPADFRVWAPTPKKAPAKTPPRRPVVRTPAAAK